MAKKNFRTGFSRRPDDLNPQRTAAFVRERIYGSVTLLAVNFGMLAQPNLTVHHAFVIILTTTFGLWAAGLLASVLAHHVVHNKRMTRKELIDEVTIHRGLLLAAVPSIIMLTLAHFDFISLRTAIIADITLAITALTVTIISTTKHVSNSRLTTIISIALQLVAALGVILLKAGAH